MSEKPKIIVIVGPTSSGKTGLSVELARKINGEIISADSRQVYRGLNLGTGKVTKKEMKNIPHHMLDILDPKNQFSVSIFQRQSNKIIKEIIGRGKVPIICGGTGFYIQSIVDNIILPEVEPKKELREKLEKLATDALNAILIELDKRRAKEIDGQNRARLIRSIEIAMTIGKVPKLKRNPTYDALQIGIDWPDEKLRLRIKKRIVQRLNQGMVKETEDLHTQGLTYKRMQALGLEYRYLSLLLQKKIDIEEFKKELEVASWHYAKRQRTWFKRDERIKWVKGVDTKKALKWCEEFLG
jgi:tRNA dimethylallyltransferase